MLVADHNDSGAAPRAQLALLQRLAQVNAIQLVRLHARGLTAPLQRLRLQIGQCSNVHMSGTPDSTQSWRVHGALLLAYLS